MQLLGDAILFQLCWQNDRLNFDSSSGAENLQLVFATEKIVQRPWNSGPERSSLLKGTECHPKSESPAIHKISVTEEESPVLFTASKEIN